jgi:hypothetical protein
VLNGWEPRPILDRSPGRYSVAAFFVLAMVLGAGTVYLVVQGILPAGIALAAALSASIAGISRCSSTPGTITRRFRIFRTLDGSLRRGSRWPSGYAS